ncbi:MAG: hypothetical protein IT341_06930 [Chloroflexi bacterium]|nr:hypothetical protein [Chloroflexota bacterium]
MRAAFDGQAIDIVDALGDLRDACGQTRSMEIVCIIWEAAQRSFLDAVADAMEDSEPDPDEVFAFAAQLRPKMPISRDKEGMMSLEIGFVVGSSRDRAAERFAEPLRLGLSGPLYCRVVVQPIINQPRLPVAPPAEAAPPDAATDVDDQLTLDDAASESGISLVEISAPGHDPVRMTGRQFDRVVETITGGAA